MDPNMPLANIYLSLTLLVLVYPLAKHGVSTGLLCLPTYRDRVVAALGC